MAIKYGMLINLSKCVGCGACALACKTENNTEHQKKVGGVLQGTKYNWADFLTKTTGTFAGGDVAFEAIPVLCNHCSDPGCLPVCPVSAITKTSTGITMIDEALCTGCQLCQDGCPYSSKDVFEVGNVKQYSVIHYNPATPAPQSFWADATTVTPGSETPANLAVLATVTPPYKNAYTHTKYSAVRAANKVEKCYFCDHRLQNGLQPYCVVSCPAGARVFGDLNDASSYISTLLASTAYKRLKNSGGEWLTSTQTGTNPNVYYAGSYAPPVPTTIKEVEDLAILQLSLYPNPSSDIVNIEFDLENSTSVTITIYDIMGREVRKVKKNEQTASGKQKVEINIYDLNAGTYICTVITDENIKSANFVVSK